MKTFIEARNQALAQLCEDLRRQFERELFGDGRPRPAFVPCPANIGNDPCDDWSSTDEWDEDY